jgi:UDP-N-acetylmuramoyl-tripeptide--D-alanyl-D-alanine ligase
MSLWTAQDAAAATGGQVASDWSATGVSIDTRTLQPGDLFVALQAARDGHDFVAQALEKGAAAALVSRVPEGVAPDKLLIVDAVLPGLERLGRAARARTQARVIAVTGSVGKTSTKEMLKTVLDRQGRTHASVESYNNHWGVPLTLARMPADTEYAVIEIGMNAPGEIAPLSQMARPHLAMITNVAAVHIEVFADGIAGIAREKASIVQGLEPEGIQVVCADVSEEAYKVLDIEMNAQLQRFWYGTETDNPWHLVQVREGADHIAAQAMTPAGPALFKLSVPGKHFALNALGVLAATQALGADPVVAAMDLAAWAPPQGRGMRETRLLDAYDLTSGFLLIDDAFNASPTSLAAALEVFAKTAPTDGVGRLHKGRRVAVLGDMLELGAEGPQMHVAVADLPSLAAVDVVHCAGPLMRALYEALPVAQRGRWHATAEALAAEARALVDAGDVVMVKGSKGSKVSLVVTALRQLSAPEPAQDLEEGRA